MGVLVLDVDYDQRVWLAVPHFPHPRWTTARSWAAEVCADLVETGALDEPDAEQRALLLADAAEAAAADAYSDYTYLHAPFGVEPPLALGLCILDAEGDEAAELRVLTNADDPFACAPPVVEPVVTGGVGTGLRVLRRVDDPEHGVLDFLTYAWRVGHADLRLRVGADDPHRLRSALEDIEVFVESITASVHERVPPRGETA